MQVDPAAGCRPFEGISESAISGGNTREQRGWYGVCCHGRGAVGIIGAAWIGRLSLTGQMAVGVGASGLAIVYLRYVGGYGVQAVSPWRGITGTWA